MDSREKNIIYLEYHQLVFENMISKIGLDNFFERVKEKGNNILKNFFSLLNPPSVYPTEQSIDILISFKKIIEENLKEIISKHNIYYWIHLYRRIGIPSIDYFDKYYLSDLITIREMMEATFLKYGLYDSKSYSNDIIKGNNIDKKEVMSGEYVNILKILDQPYEETANGIFIKKFSIDDYIEIFSIEWLINIYVSITGSIRRLYKKGLLIVDENLNYHVENDEETEKLIESYDERNEQYSLFITKCGIPVDQMNVGKNLFLIPIFNINKLKNKDIPFFKLWNVGHDNIENEDYCPKYFWIPFNLNDFYQKHLFIKEPFKKEHGFSLECFINCIYAIFLHIHYMLSNFINETYKISYISQLHERAYCYFGKYNDFIDLFHDIIVNNKLVFNIRKTRRNTIKFINEFTYDESKTNRIDLTTRNPRFLFFKFDNDDFFIDFSALGNILYSSMFIYQAEVSKKGEVFENYFNKKLKDEGFEFWSKGQFIGIDKTKKEIDNSFVCGNILFICELKCINMSYAYQRGEINALNFRKEKLSNAIEEVDERANWLASRPIGKNYKIPNNIYAIIPIVISPFVEYIWTKNDYLWLTKKIPRICTINELIFLKDKEVLKEIINKSYVKYIN